MVVFLHVFTDPDFYDSVSSDLFKTGIIVNRALFIGDDNSPRLKRVKNISAVTSLQNKKAIKDFFLKENYDVVFFHSLTHYDWIEYIPLNKIVIWWGWGYDLYTSINHLKPLLSVNLYKKCTSDYTDIKQKGFHGILSNLKWNLLKPISKRKQIRGLKRINYFMPVIKLEYENMCKKTAFSAKEFYYIDYLFNFEKSLKRKKDGNVLLGNSSTPTNNHLDVLNEIKDKLTISQKVIVPLNYGDMDYKEWLMERVDNRSNIVPLFDYLQKTEYEDIIDSCSYAIFGVMRQQAMWNINYALSKGIKVFLYKDSMVYKCLKELGFCVFAIETMAKDSLSCPLSNEEHLQNILAFEKETNRRTAIYNTCMKEIVDSLK